MRKRVNIFSLLCKVLYIQLATLVGEFTEDDFQDTGAALQHVIKLTQCFQDLAGYVKSNDKKDVLGVTLRHSKTFMEQFIKRVIPFLGVHFKGHQDAVAKIFRHHLQPATRSLQVKNNIQRTTTVFFILCLVGCLWKLTCVKI